ncbi:MAG: transferase hexapeptide repeat containing protein [Merismopedia sp. SIO2A8]|nr:transferase hexapeptide repeat containing protein [Symploca sp. SIO2B6]NET53723.1 transferase hexapeptide repeat containing protein [Merismopedia sp. SIO2A8]
MLEQETLEQRVIKLEKLVSLLQLKVTSFPVESHSGPNWLESLMGSISDEGTFLEALEYGRTFRQSDESVDKDDEAA